MNDFGNILNAYSTMSRTKTGRVEEKQTKIAHPDFKDKKDEIIDIMNAVRSVNGLSNITEESIEADNVLKREKMTENSRKMIDIYARSIK